MTMADTIAVMNAGRIEQLGSPTELYEHPASTFVANFLGRSNLVSGTVTGVDGDLVAVAARGRRLNIPARNCRVSAGNVIVGVRPEKMRIAKSVDDVPRDHNVLPGGVITDASFIGVSTQYLVKMGWGEELAVFEQNTGAEIFRPGTDVTLHWHPEQTFGLDGAQDIEAGTDVDMSADTADLDVDGEVVP